MNNYSIKIQGIESPFFPNGLSGLKLVLDKKQDERFFRKKIVGTLDFTGKDFKNILPLEVECCKELGLIITEDCNGMGTFYEGKIKTNQLEWDFEIGSSRLNEILQKDEYLGVYKYWEKKVNVCSIVKNQSVSYVNRVQGANNVNSYNDVVNVKGCYFVDWLYYAITKTFTGTEYQYILPANKDSIWRGRMPEAFLTLLPAHSSRCPRKQTGDQKRRSGGEAADQDGLQSPSERGRAGRFGFKEAEYGKCDQCDEGRPEQRGPGLRNHEIGTERDQAPRDIGPGNRQGAGKGAFWLGLLQTKLKAHHEVHVGLGFFLQSGDKRGGLLRREAVRLKDFSHFLRFPVRQCLHLQLLPLSLAVVMLRIAPGRQKPAEAHRNRSGGDLRQPSGDDDMGCGDHAG